MVKNKIKVYTMKDIFGDRKDPVFKKFYEKEMKRLKKKLPEIDRFLNIIPVTEIERILGKRELKHFNSFMRGQTISLLKEQGGIYKGDLERFLYYRNKGMKGKQMPLDG